MTATPVSVTTSEVSSSNPEVSGLARPWLRVAGELLIGGAVALLFYFGIMGWLMQRYPPFPPDTARILEIVKFCSSPAMQQANAKTFVLGSSVAVEGIDAAIMDSQRAGETQQSSQNKTHSQVFNLALTGCSPREMLLLLPAVEAGQPQTVIVGFDAFGFQGEELNTEKLHAYRSAQVFDAMNPSLRNRLSDFFTPHEVDILKSPQWRALLDSRALPLFYMESWFRERARTQLRMEGYATNFRAPWIRRSDLDEQKKEREIAAAKQRFSKMRLELDNSQLAASKLLVEHLRSRNIRVVGVLWPIHPRLQNAYAPGFVPEVKTSLREIMESAGGKWIDCSQLLGEAEFSDSVHPNALGRERLSRTLAQAVNPSASPNRRSAAMTKTKTVEAITP